jgi:hypothetical protein
MALESFVKLRASRKSQASAEPVTLMLLAYSLFHVIMRMWLSRSYFSLSGIPERPRQNLNKHGVAFERVATIFLDPRAPVRIR